jgi:hypothetical protein
MPQTTHEQIEQLIATGVHKICGTGARDKLLEILGLGSTWRHFRSANVYVILGVTFNTETDEWDVRYQRIEPTLSVEFNRAPPSFFGSAPTGDMVAGESTYVQRFSRL